MTSKRKWDDTASEGSISPASANKVARSMESHNPSSSAPAVAAMITAHTSTTGIGLIGGGEAQAQGYGADVDINDLRNRYALTNSLTRQQIRDEIGAFAVAKGTWYPDSSKAAGHEPLEKVNELINLDAGPLEEDSTVRGHEGRKWPEEKLLVGVDSLRNFNVRTRIAGPTGVFLKYIQQETGARVHVKGLGSGFVEPDTGRESDGPMYIHIVGPDEDMVARARALANDLLSVLRREHAKALQRVQEREMGRNHAQVQTAACIAIDSGEYAPQAPGSAPSHPPDKQPSPSPDVIRQQQQSASPLPSEADAYTP